MTLVAKMGKDSGQLFTCRVHVPPVIQPRARRRLPFPPVWLDFNTPWQMLPGTHEPADYNEWTDLVAIDPSRHNVIIAGGIGLQRSTDGGQTFSTVTGTHADHHALVFARSNNDLCYMACDGGVFRSVDDGASWTLRSSGLVATQLYSIGVSQTDPFLLGGATQDQGIIKTNGPADWTDTGAGNEGGFFIVDPLNSSNVYVTPWSDNLRRSTDGGTTWQTIVTGITQTGIAASRRHGASSGGLPDRLEFVALRRWQRGLPQQRPGQHLDVSADISERRRGDARCLGAAEHLLCGQRRRPGVSQPSTGRSKHVDRALYRRQQAAVRHHHRARSPLRDMGRRCPAGRG